MDARDLLARLDGLGVTVAADGDRLLIRPASMLTDELRAELRAAKPAVLALLAAPVGSQSAQPCGESAAVRFAARRARLIRWSWPQDEAQAMAERLARRDLAGDDMVSCTECKFYRPSRCGNHRGARLHSPELGRDLTRSLQRCPGFQSGYCITAQSGGGRTDLSDQPLPAPNVEHNFLFRDSKKSC